MDAFLVALKSVLTDSGFMAFTAGNAIMILVGCIRFTGHRQGL